MEVPLKLFLILIPFISLSSLLFAQRVQLQLSAGNGFADGGIPISSYDRSDAAGPDGIYITTTQNVHDKYYDVGEGFRIESRVILFFEDNIGCFAQYSHSSGNETGKTTYSEDNSTGVNTSTINFNSSSVQGGLHYQTGEGLLQPFGGLGAGYFFHRKFTLSNESAGESSSSYVEQQLTTNSPVGYVAYLGLNISPVPVLSLFVEAKATLVTYYVTRTEITAYRYNGINQLGSLNTNERITVYEENKSYSTGSQSDVNLPANGGPPNPVPANTISITAGISIRL
jgi:hypothetical protein